MLNPVDMLCQRTSPYLWFIRLNHWFPQLWFPWRCLYYVITSSQRFLSKPPMCLGQNCRQNRAADTKDVLFWKSSGFWSLHPSVVTRSSSLKSRDFKLNASKQSVWKITLERKDSVKKPKQSLRLPRNVKLPFPDRTGVFLQTRIPGGVCSHGPDAAPPDARRLMKLQMRCIHGQDSGCHLVCFICPSHLKSASKSTSMF